MTDYKARFKRDGDGGYLASYGKNTRKLNATITKAKQGWTISKGDGPAHLMRAHVPKLADLKADWEKWCRIEWPKRHGVGRPPSHKPKPKGPPRHVPGPRVATHYKKPRPGQQPRDLTYEFGSDPFDARFKYGHEEQDTYKKKQLTPLGVTVEVLAWCMKHPHLTEQVPEFAPLVDTVKECVRREAEDAYQFLLKMKEKADAEQAPE